jgi:hypothetical protein
MIFDGIEFVVNPDMPEGRRGRILNNRQLEMTPQLYVAFQTLDNAGQLTSGLAKLGERLPASAELAAEFARGMAPFIEEARQVIDEMKRMPAPG